MVTRALIAYLVTMAGPGYAWTDQPSSRPSSLARTGLARFLQDYAGSLCTMCGTFAAYGEIAHIVSCGPNKKGYCPGNLGWCCLPCNDLDAKQGPVIAYETIRHPELIPTQWPSSHELERIGQTVRDEREGEILEKKFIRGIK